MSWWDKMSGGNIYKRWPVVAAETEHLHEDNKNGENRSGVLRSCAHFPLRLDISLFLQGDPGWSRLPHSLPQTLSSSSSHHCHHYNESLSWSSLSAAQQRIIKCSHIVQSRGTLDHWTLALWLLYIRQHQAMKHSATGASRILDSTSLVLLTRCISTDLSQRLSLLSEVKLITTGIGMMFFINAMNAVELKCKIISWFIIKYKFINGELIRK